MILFLKRLFCRHRWAKTAVYQETDEARNIRYGLRQYRCLDCGKISMQDSRCDRLEAKSVKPWGKD